MGYVISLVLASIAYYKYKLDGNDLANPVTLFCGTWAIVTFMATLRLFNMIETSNQAWLVIFTGAMFCVLGTHAGGIVAERVRIVNRANSRIRDRINTNLVNGTVLILFIYYCYNLINTNVIENLISGNSLAYIRSQYVDQFFYKVENPIITVVGTYVIAPLAYCITPLLIYRVIALNKKGALVTVLALNILDAITTGGRYGLFIMMFQFAVGTIIMRKRMPNRSLKEKKKVRKVIIVILIMLFFATISRLEEASQFVESMYMYLCGSVPHLSLRIGESIEPLYGMASLNGLISPLAFIANNIGLHPYSNDYLLFKQIIDMQAYYRIGPSMFINAYVTSFYYPYMDGGLFGVAFFMFAFGTGIGYVYRKMMTTMKIVYIVTYFIFAGMIFRTIIGYPFGSSDGVLGILFALFMFKKVSGSDQKV